MRLSSVFVRGLFALSAAIGFVQGAAAQDSRSPVIVIGAQDIDPAKYDWLSENGRKTLQALIDQKKAAAVTAFVFAGAPGGDYWAFRAAAKPTDPYSLPELARQALQACEYFANGGCFVISINGKEARDANGTLPVQPRQLVRPPSTFDISFIPFLTRDDQQKMRGYATQTAARALVITSGSGALWRAGDNAFAAVANALAECQKTFPNQACLLYAVNDRVVFAPGGPY